VAEGKNLAAAREAWGAAAPDWIVALAEACDRTSQSRVAGDLALSASAVNAVLRGRYAAGTGRIEQLVRGRLMAAVVPCPQLGELAADLCQEWQGRARGKPASAFHRRMQAACRTCPRSRLSMETPA
jgi:hypothetical protein